jgi:phage repressor protein C with HTH and peptisase S24 domain
MDIYDNRRQWLTYWIQTLVNGDRSAFERLYGYSRSQVAQFLSRTYQDGRSIGDIAARRLEKKLGFADRVMDTPFSDAAAHAAGGSAGDVVRTSAGASAHSKGFPARPITTYNSLDELPAETTILITHVDVALSAGNGRETWHVEEKEPLPFQADYVRRLDASPKHLVAVKVRGDSMEPRLFDDDTVVVDKADRRIPTGGGVFALVYCGEMLVKRLFRLPDGSIRVVSDNKEKHDPFIVPPEQLEHIDIVGRVKYRSGMGDF